MKVIKFGAEYCPPCKAIDKWWGELSSEFKKYEFIKYDAVDNPQEMLIYKITSLPTIIIMDDGLEIKRHIGMITQEQFKEMINNVR